MVILQGTHFWQINDLIPYFSQRVTQKRNEIRHSNMESDIEDEVATISVLLCLIDEIKEQIKND